MTQDKNIANKKQMNITHVQSGPTAFSQGTKTF